MSYRLAGALIQLRGEANAARPGRSKVSDGWIGDAAWTYAIGGTAWSRSLHRGRPARVDRFLGRYLTVERYGRVFEVVFTDEVSRADASSAATRLMPDTP